MAKGKKNVALSKINLNRTQECGLKKLASSITIITVQLLELGTKMFPMLLYNKNLPWVPYQKEHIASLNW